LAPQPSDPAFVDFANAAAMACLFEIKARLFADNTPALEKHKADQLEALVKRIIEHERDGILPEDEVLLKKCARFRNKLLHANFSQAAGTLLSFGVELDQGTVYLTKLEDASVRKLSETSTTDGRVFGWMLEGKSSGVFREARKVFVRGIAFINWRLARASGLEAS
jgi:hypothetical protein